MKLRWKILIGLGIFFVLMAASLTVTMRVQPEREVDAYKKLLRDKGEKLELNELLPQPASADENSADSVQAAFSVMGSGITSVPQAMTMVAPGRALIGARQPDVRSYDFTNSWDGFAATVEADRPVTELLHQVLYRPKLDFRLDYSKGFETLMPHLMPMKRAAQILDASVIYDLHAGKSAEATTNILTTLAIVQKDVRDGMLISHLVRIAIASIAVTPTWELLQATNVTDAQLAAVQDGWRQLNWLNDAEDTFQVERIMSEMIIEKLRNSHEEFKKLLDPMGYGGGSGGGSTWTDMLDDFTSGPRDAVGEAMWRFSWSYSAELNELKGDQIVIEAMRSMQTNRSQFYKADYDTMSSRLSSLGYTNIGDAFFRALDIPDFSEYFDIGGPGPSPAVRKILQIETARRVVITAIALKRFELKHGKWPEKLDDLVPEFISSVPIDPFDGKPLKYRPNEDGTYLLYSVAQDGIDDGGAPTTATAGNSSLYWQGPKARDWVWPQPATAAEIQYYYEHPPK